jgi:myosin heavy subunit
VRLAATGGVLLEYRCDRWSSPTSKCIPEAARKKGTLFQILAGLLHLGNVNFNNDSTRRARPRATPTPAAEVLGMKADEIRAALTERVMVTMGETIIVQRSASAAKFCRDSRIFEWIVTSLNVALGQKTEDVLFIGVLGIFGFERFERSDSEQLLVNYTSEALQATFNSPRNRPRPGLCQRSHGGKTRS